MKFAFMQNPLTQILFFAWIYNSFINSHLLEWLKVRQIKSGIRVNFGQCDRDKSYKTWIAYIFFPYRCSLLKALILQLDSLPLNVTHGLPLQ